jgi:predicted membrane metal-binding protein
MSTPLIPITIAWLVGIWLASRIALPTLALGVATIITFVGIVVTWRVRKLRWILVLALAAILGALRYNFAQPHFDQASLAMYNDQQKSVIVEGIVVGEPDVCDTYTNLRVEADRLIITDPAAGVTRTVKGPRGCGRGFLDSRPRREERLWLRGTPKIRVPGHPLARV